MFQNDHPPAFSQQHPWHDPFAPQDIFAPRPDQERHALGGVAPNPEHFPFTHAGRQEYYAAVRAAEQQQQIMQHMHMDRMRGAEGEAEAQARADAAAEAATRAQQASVLLLMP